jgi:hypothetical protein
MYRFLRTVGFFGLVAVGARAQITETPVTVQPGHFLLEMDAVSVAVDHEPGAKYTAFGTATTFLTTGLTSRLDLQLGARLFINQKYESGSFTERRTGVGDLYVRTKWRVYDSPDSYSAVALLPYVKIPTNSNGLGHKAVEGGLIVPVGAELIGGFNFAAMGQLDFQRNAQDTGYDSHWFASAEVTRNILNLIAIYGEATAGKATGGRPWEGTMGAGVTVHVSALAWWDFAIYRGISNGASDWNHVVRFNYGF